MKKLGKNLQKFTMAIVVVMFLAMLLCFEKIAEAVGGATNQATETITGYAKIALGVSIGLFLISSGAAAMAVPIVGVALIAVGVILVAYVLWPFFQRGDTSE